MSLKITSPAFAHGDPIPEKYTCDGRNISPPLAWSDVPDATASLALIAEDPDAPSGTFVHWIVYRLPSSAKGLDEGLTALPNGALQGTNGFRKIGYGGPCPPSGTHRYYFRLYALDNLPDLKPGASRDEIGRKLEGHVLEQAELMGRYQKK